ncbi:MAG TPA: NAD(P)-dependent alcohol dehydrogenase [Candidatus Limnocylindrales bacterium]|nr:NAD(P)-dependent alcohol dehydrogenase [Candidatus Limnocylindrales bacterium]
MRAAIRERYGSPDVVEVRDIEVPVPTGDQVLVRVGAASVNRGDLDWIEPRPEFVRLFLGLRAPRNPRIGIDAAGVVESLGPGATRFNVGDRVFGDLFRYGQGAFAEYVCAPETAFLPIPDWMRVEDAATLPHAGILAIQGLRLRDGRTIAPGDKVLISGASGNVGPFAVQIAKALGAEVTGVASASKVDLVRSLGADHVIDYATTDYATTGERYDWILDVDGHHSMLEARHALRRGGVYITLGGSGARIVQTMLVGPILSALGDTRGGLSTWWQPFRAADVATLTSMIEAGEVRPVIDRRFPLADVVDALRWVDDKRARGKVLVIP